MHWIRKPPNLLRTIAGRRIVVLAVLFYLLPFQELWRTIRRISPSVWLMVLAGYTLAHLMAMTKWRLMVNLAGAGLNYTQAARCYFAGLFGNLFLPSLVGGDVVRAGMALKLGKSKAGVLLGSLLDRMLDVAALASVAALGALLGFPLVLWGIVWGLIAGGAGALSRCGDSACASRRRLWQRAGGWDQHRRLGHCPREQTPHHHHRANRG